LAERILKIEFQASISLRGDRITIIVQTPNSPPYKSLFSIIELKKSLAPNPPNGPTQNQETTQESRYPYENKGYKNNTGGTCIERIGFVGTHHGPEKSKSASARGPER
tara:strand:- start:421 stop:744 length:324 start_codon:yes stop_codon:yes gene_type:complete